MGLDNSIEIKRTPYTDSISELRQFNLDWDNKHEYDFSVCYWRKCWNIRNGILDILGDRFSDQWRFHLNTENIDKIIAFLKSLNKHNWNDNGGSIWTWEEYKNHIKDDIKKLKMLRKLMKKYDLKVVFIDSY